MRRSGNREETKRIIMDLDVVIKSHDCPYIVQCIGTFITKVSTVTGHWQTDRLSLVSFSLFFFLG